MPLWDENVGCGLAGARDFRTTHWSVVLRAGDHGSSEAEAALAQLYQTYWYPLYAYLRRQGSDPESASDLVQDLFVVLQEKKQLALVDPDKGRFRSYLLSSIKHMLANEWQKTRREKRGGGRPVLSLDSLNAEERYALEPADTRTPEALFDCRWALALLDRVKTRLQNEWQGAGKEDVFEVMKVYLSGDEDVPGYAEVGTQVGLSEGAARVAVHRLRQQYRELLRDEIAQTVEGPGQIEDELRHLLAALRT